MRHRIHLGAVLLAYFLCVGCGSSDSVEIPENPDPPPTAHPERLESPPPVTPNSP